MTYYVEDPRRGLPIIVTVHGDNEYLENCKKYADGYYVKGKDLVYTGFNWVKRAVKGFDNEAKQDVEDVTQLLHGIIGFEAEKPLFGYFSSNVYNNCKVNKGDGTFDCINVALLDPLVYIEKYAEGVFYDTTGWTAKQKADLQQRVLLINNNNKTYNIEDDELVFAKMQQSFENSKFPISTDLKCIGRFLGKTTFGIELETINGTLPTHICNKYGVIICKDGSIRNHNAGNNPYPPEYVTIPYSGAKGLQAIRDVTIEIAKRSEIDIRCSLHAHFGGFKIDRLLLVSLYKLCHKIQNDVFKMFPYYKLNPDGIKQQNYCKKLPDILTNFGKKDFNKYINTQFNDLYTYLSGGNAPNIENNRKLKVNPWGGAKWNIKTRYHWVNFVNPMFGKRDTIEFRIHTPTLNADKVINWLFMCNAIIHYAGANTKLCISNTEVTFVDVLRYYEQAFKGTCGEAISEKLIGYYNNRVDYFAKDFAARNYISNEELQNDANFEFNITKLR